MAARPGSGDDPSMGKMRLVPLATLALATLPCAAEDDPVTLYGRVYATVESVRADGAAPRLVRVSDQSSRLGVKGAEQVAPGTKVFFQLETAFQPDQNDTTFAGRNSGVGLQNAAGSFLLGRWDVPFKVANYDVDVFGDFTIGAFSMALQGSGVANVNGQFNRRDQNVVQYWSPVLSGFQLKLTYAANEARSATANPRSEGGTLTWTRGGIYAGYGYHELRDQPYGIYTNVAPVMPAVLTTGSVQVGRQVGQSVFAAFDVGPLRFGADYQEFKRTDPVAPAVPTPATVTGFSKQKAWMGNVTWKLGAHKLMYQYLQTKGGIQQARDAVYTPASPGCDVNAIAWQYDFSKRTFVIAQYVRVRNNPTATCTLGQNPLALVAGQDPDGYSIGMHHIF